MRMRAAVLAFAAACLLPGSRAENRVYLKWDEENLQHVGPVESQAYLHGMPDDRVFHRVLYDLRSPWTWLPHFGCQRCKAIEDIRPFAIEYSEHEIKEHAKICLRPCGESRYEKNGVRIDTEVSCVWEVDKVLSHWEKLEASPLQEEGFVVGKRCGVTLQIAGQRVDADQNKIVAAQYVTRGTEKHVDGRIGLGYKSNGQKSGNKKNVSPNEDMEHETVAERLSIDTGQQVSAFTFVLGARQGEEGKTTPWLDFSAREGTGWFAFEVKGEANAKGRRDWLIQFDHVWIHSKEPLPPPQLLSEPRSASTEEEGEVEGGGRADPPPDGPDEDPVLRLSASASSSSSSSLFSDEAGAEGEETTESSPTVGNKKEEEFSSKRATKAPEGYESFSSSSELRLLKKKCKGAECQGLGQKFPSHVAPFDDRTTLAAFDSTTPFIRFPLPPEVFKGGSWKESDSGWRTSVDALVSLRPPKYKNDVRGFLDRMECESDTQPRMDKLTSAVLLCSCERVKRESNWGRVTFEIAGRQFDLGIDNLFTAKPFKRKHKTSNKCLFLVVPSASTVTNTWVLGTGFLTRWAASFDIDGSFVSLSGHYEGGPCTRGNPGDLHRLTSACHLPQKPKKTWWKRWRGTIQGLAWVAILVTLLCVFICCYRRALKQDERARQEMIRDARARGAEDPQRDAFAAAAGIGRRPFTYDLLPKTFVSPFSKAGAQMPSSIAAEPSGASGSSSSSNQRTGGGAYPGLHGRDDTGTGVGGNRGGRGSGASAATGHQAATATATAQDRDGNARRPTNVAGHFANWYRKSLHVLTKKRTDRSEGASPQMVPERERSVRGTEVRSERSTAGASASSSAQ